MKKLIIIPAYNESESIVNTVRNIQKKAPEFDYIVINDCSKDATLEVLKENNINHLNLPVNLGIGGAVQTGYKYALEKGYDVAVQVDGDGQHDPSYLNKLAEAMISQQADMIIGSRFIENQGFQSTFMRRIGISYFTKMIKILTGKTITDPTSGFRMANREVIKIFSKEYPRDYPEPESIVALLRLNKKVAEIPVEMRERQGGESSIKLSNSIYYMIKVSLAILVECSRKREI
ncbi:MAG: glycosyltransferase family 2 protein [Erysipelotrichaceae bacterium]|nr:glycosyltransferase family 2 protein [Erysipelotrichaceae bacterium]